MANSFSSSAARQILVELCSAPTAPFVEERVIAFAERFAKERRLRISRDKVNNLLLELPTRRRAGKPRWVFTAHMDHPGFVAESMLDRRTLSARFHGGVEASYFVGAKVTFFPPGGEVSARVIACQVDEENRPIGATLRVEGEAPPGTPGMWSQGEGRITGKRFLSRVCDDLAGAAAALAMLDALRQARPAVDIAVLLTRAEEEGFIGALAAVKNRALLRRNDRVIAIECSAAQPFAPQGAGAIIRIGDRTSIFNSSLSYFLNQVATDLSKTDKAFKFQRALMPGGTCEATVYDVWGYHAGSICVPLGNYHNMDKAKGKIGREYIDLGDWESMVKLFIALAQRGHEYEPGHKALKERLEKRYAKFAKLLG